MRSEEHTSELQSLTNLVCRLLLDTTTPEIYTLSLHDALPIFLGVDKVTKYHMDAPMNTVTFQWLMSPRTYAAMSPAQKKVIDDHCTTEWAGKFADPWADFEHEIGRAHV